MRKTGIFLIAFVLGLLAGNWTRIGSGYQPYKIQDTSTDSIWQINENFRYFSRAKQDRCHEIRTVAPTANDLDEGEIVFYGTKIYTVLDGIVKTYSAD